MIAILILSIILFFVGAFLVLAIGVGGAIGVVAFADVIVCVLFIGWLIKKLLKKH